MDISAAREAFLASVAAGPTIMGIVNATPDSFSDGGLFTSPEAALAQAKKLVADCAGIVDIGAELTRPGHQPISAEVEWERLLPLLAVLVEQVAPGFDRHLQVGNSAPRAASWRRGHQ